MRVRWLIALVLAGAMVGLLSPQASASSETSDQGLQMTRLPQILRTIPPAPTFERQIATSTDLKHVAEALDECDGPVAVPFAGWGTILVAEHDFCGGSEWISRLHRGQAVRLSGPGVDSGIYMVGDFKRAVIGEARVRDLPDADVVLQTCISKTKVVLVGMTLVAA